MTPVELAIACKDAIERGSPQVVLTLPRVASKREAGPRGDRIRLVGGRGRCPRGYILNEQERDGRWQTVAGFDPIDFLSACGVVEVEVRRG